MNVSEVIELTNTMTIAEIARDHLTIGEKPARLALKKAGCYSIVGKQGWFFDESENPDNLHESIYFFADRVKQEQDGLLKAAANLDSKEVWSSVEDIPRKRHSFDLDVRLVKQLKIHCVKQDKKLYEAVETAIRDYLDNQTGVE